MLGNTSTFYLVLASSLQYRHHRPRRLSYGGIQNDLQRNVKSTVMEKGTVEGLTVAKYENEE